MTSINYFGNMFINGKQFVDSEFNNGAILSSIYNLSSDYSSGVYTTLSGGLLTSANDNNSSGLFSTGVYKASFIIPQYDHSSGTVGIRWWPWANPSSDTYTVTYNIIRSNVVINSGVYYLTRENRVNILHDISYPPLTGTIDTPVYLDYFSLPAMDYTNTSGTLTFFGGAPAQVVAVEFNQGQYQTKPTLFTKGQGVRTNLDASLPTARYYYPVQDDSASGVTMTPAVPDGSLYTLINKNPTLGAVNDSSYITFTGSGEYYTTVFNLSGIPLNPSSVLLNLRYSGNTFGGSQLNKLNIDGNPRYLALNSSEEFMLLNPSDYFLSGPASGTFNTYNLNTSTAWRNDSFDITNYFDWSSPENSGCFVVQMLNGGSYMSVSAMEIEVDSLGPNPLYMGITGHNPFSGNTTLYTYGSLPYSGNVPLFTFNSVPDSGSVDLYMPVSTKITASGTLYTFAESEPLSNSMNLEISNGRIWTVRPVPLITRSYGTTKTATTPLWIGTRNNSWTTLTKNGNLVIKNFSGTVDGMNLFIGAPTSGTFNKAIPLYTKSFGTSFSGTPVNMFLKGLGTASSIRASGNPTFFISNYSGINTNMPLYLGGQGMGSGNTNMPLFLKVKPLMFSSGKVNLFTANNFGTKSGGITLKLSAIYATGNMSLVLANTQTGYASGGIPFYIAQKNDVSYSSGNVSLYISSSVFNQFPLFISGKTNDIKTLTTNLFVYSNTNSGINKIAPMFLESENYNRNMNLFLANSASALNAMNSSMNLIVGHSNQLFNILPLLLNNTGRNINSGVRLVTVGAGLNDGYNFGYSSIPLFLARSVNSVDNRVPLYLEATRTINTGVSLYMSGGTYSNNNMNLTMPATKGIPSGNLSLHVLGF